MTKPFFVDYAALTGVKKKGKNRRHRAEFCEQCEIALQCLTPRMEPFGKGKRGVAVVGMCPGKQEDIRGKPFRGKSGKLLKNICKQYGLSLDKDCAMTNAVQCYPPKGEWPGDAVAMLCRNRLVKQLKKLKPKVIVALGEHAIQSVLHPPMNPTTGKMHNRVIPSLEFGCWVICCFHPAYFLRGNIEDQYLLEQDIETAVRVLKEKPGGVYDFEERINTVQEDVGNEVVTDPELFEAKLGEFKESGAPVAFDFETIGLIAQAQDAEILCCSFSNDPVSAFTVPLSKRYYNYKSRVLKRMNQLMGHFLKSKLPKVVHNIAMEDPWSRQFYGTHVKHLECDTMVFAHIIDERKKTKSLEFQTYCLFGTRYKQMVNTKQLLREPKLKVYKYNCLDSRYGLALYNHQQLTASKADKKAWKFFKSGCMTMSRLKYRGVGVNRSQLDHLKLMFQLESQNTGKKLARNKVVKAFQDEKRTTFNSSSNQQIAYILATEAIDTGKRTKGKQISVSAESLESLLETELPKSTRKFIEQILKVRKNDSGVSKLISYEKLVCPDGKVHPSFGLHVTETYRSACMEPNVQNVPIRDKILAPIRSIYVPTIGDWLAEGDIGGAEVRVLCMLSKCEELVRQVRNGVDMHRRWAARIYEKKECNISSQERYQAKNGFVFPEFYGSTAEPSAKRCEVSLSHMKRVERWFWKEYHDLKAWHKWLFKTYEKKGYVKTPLGFRRYAPLTEFQIINTPVQGTSFHILLAGLNVADVKMVKIGMKSRIVLQVHDSGLVDTLEEEQDDVRRLMTKAITKHRFDWQNVPMIMDWKKGKNWFEMEKWE